MIVGGLGFVLFIFSLFSGLDHDIDHDGSIGGDISSDDLGHVDGASLFSYRTIVTFMATFGASGAIAQYSGLGFMPSAIVGVFSGVLFALFAWWLMNVAFKQQASSLVTSADLIGKTGIVNVPMLGGNLGEVSLEVKGQRKAYQAKSKDGLDIKENASVKIVADMGVFIVVEPIS